MRKMAAQRKKEVEREKVERKDSARKAWGDPAHLGA